MPEGLHVGLLMHSVLPRAALTWDDARTIERMREVRWQ